MFGLPTPEKIAFVSVVVVYLAASIVGVLQLLAGGDKYKRFLLPFVSLAVTLEAVILIFRAVAIKAVPLTGLFESMIVLTIVFGLIYLFFSIVIQQVWFGSVMVWVILAMILLTAAVAEPASEPHIIAATPWAIAHGIAMILGGATIVFATTTAFLYLLGRRKLKQKKIMQVLGRVPNIEKLDRMNLFGIRVGFVLITIGLISGLGLASLRSTMLEIRFVEWLTDAKFVCTVAVWLLLGMILILNRLVSLKSNFTAYMTIVAFLLVLFTIAGVAILGVTKHDFSRGNETVVSVRALNK